MRKVFVVLLTTLSASAFAQTGTPPPVQKIGYADWEYIFTQMPEAKQIDTEMKTYGEQLQSQLKAKYAEYESKLKAYQASAATLVDAVRRDKEAELTQLQENIQKFQQDAQTSLQKKQNDLMAPVFSKIGKAVEEVAKENGFAFILAPQVVGGGDILLYSDDKYDVSSLVLKRLGITPTAAVVPKK
jgi:outer membrane protein